MPEPTNSAPSAPTPVRPTKTDHPEWDVDDALALRSFFETRSGLRALAWLKYWEPHLLDGEHKNKTLVASGEVKGYNEAIDFLRSLMVENPIPEAPKATTEYHDLDDDSKWTEDENVRK